MEERIGHYSIVSELGRGGMGVVYKAHEQSLNRFVALKVLGKHLSEDESYVERFKREAQSAAALNHPNIVQIYSIDEFDGQHCFAMEFVFGASIQQMIKSQGPIDPADAARLILQAASGLGSAHSHGVIHRDVKPANLMVDERGLVKITDFGLALLAAGATRLTATGMFMGTPGYLSPEQCLDEDVDHRTDIYSLGVTLYEMLTGITPFKADSPLALLRQIIDVEPQEVGDLRPEVPEALQSILKKMMAKKREERYPACEPLVADLQEWLETTAGPPTEIGSIVAAVAGRRPNPTSQGEAVSLEEFNTDPTIKVDSAELLGSPPPPPLPPVPEPAVTTPVEPNDPVEPELVPSPVVVEPPSKGKSRLALGLAVAAIAAVVLLAVTGYAAWRFGVFDTVKTLFAGSSSSQELSSQASIDPSATAPDVGDSTANATDTPPIDDSATEDPGADEYDDVERKAQGITAPGATTLEAEQQTTSAQPPKSESRFESVVSGMTTGSNTVNQRVSEASPDRSHQSPPKDQTTSVQPAIGTGVALVGAGEHLLSDAASDYVRKALQKRGIKVIDGLSVPGVAAAVESGGESGSLQELLQPHARYLLVVRADYIGDRELQYMGRYDREYQARLHLVAHDLLDGTPLGPGIHVPIGYTQLTVDRKVSDLLRPKFRKIAGNLTQ